MGNPNGHLIHGLCGTSLYAIWQTMKQRCENPNCRGYEWYGAKGIKVCSEWQSVTTFHDWAKKNGYQKGLTLDRIDSSQNYSPDNCRWVTMSQQQSNKSNNHVIEYKGEVHTLTEWSQILMIPRTTLSNRLTSLGWTVERAFAKGGRV